MRQETGRKRRRVRGDAAKPAKPARSAKPAKPVDARPYIRDVSRSPESAVDAATVTIGMVVLALAVGFVIGFAVFCVMNLSTWLTELPFVTKCS